MNTLLRCAGILALACAPLASARAEDAPRATYGSAPWKIHQTAPAQYPPSLTYNGVTHGDACVRISIDASGQLLDALVIACSHRDFGEEALRAVKRWRYEPEWIEGQPIGIVADISFAFQMNGLIAVEKRSPAPNAELYAPLDPFAYKAEGLNRLDRVPNPTRVVPPVYPKDWSDRGLTGSVTVDFYIDETGRARVPVATSDENHLLGASAAAAVAQWQFEPPTCQGKPMLVHAEQIFTFQPEKK